MKLTELEHAVLGVVSRRGPCSAYAVQANFELVSAGWSASPGSVYPLVGKLCRLGLLSRREESWGARGKSLYAITSDGRRELERWLAEVPDWLGRPPADAIRTRAFFLDALPDDAGRLAYVERAAAVTRAALDRLERGLATADADTSPLERLGQRGGIHQLRSRLDWLEELRSHFAGSGET